MYEGGILLSEFGSRRRRSYETQKLVMEGLIRADKELKGTAPGRLSGTSNVTSDLAISQIITLTWVHSGSLRSHVRLNSHRYYCTVRNFDAITTPGTSD